MSNRGNMFANIENKFKFATEAEIREMTMESATEFLNNFMCVSDTDDEGAIAETVVGILVIGAVIGTMQAGNLTTKRKSLIDYVLGNLFRSVDMDWVYENVDNGIMESQYDVINRIASFGNVVAIPLFHLYMSPLKYNAKAV